MTNAEKLIELLKENFENADNIFVSKQFLEEDCFFILCPDEATCLECPLKNFWKDEYKGLTNK